MRIIFLIISLLIFCSCFLIPKTDIVIPEEPLKISMENAFQEILILIELFSMRNEQRIYDEVFSDSLKAEISLKEFKTDMSVLTKTYGKLAPFPMSHLRSMVNPNEWNLNEDDELKEPVIFKGLFEYEKKTIYFSFSFKGKPDNLKMDKYMFIED